MRIPQRFNELLSSVIITVGVSTFNKKARDEELNREILTDQKLIDCIEDYILDVDLAAAVEIENVKSLKKTEIEKEIKYAGKEKYRLQKEVVRYENEIVTLKKLNQLCEEEFNFGLVKKYSRLDLANIASEMKENLKTIEIREGYIAEYKKRIEIEQEELTKLEKQLSALETPAEKKLQFEMKAISSAQKDFKRAYLEGNLQIASDIFDTLKIFYRAYAETKKAA